MCCFQFLVLYIPESKSNVRFSFENLSKIENLYISQVEGKKKRNLAKDVKNEILLCRKKNFSVQTYRQKSKNIPNLQVMRKKIGLSNPHSNKTACTGCLTN